MVMKGMSKRREDRYATAGEFADDLQRVLDGHPIVARPPTLLDRACAGLSGIARSPPRQPPFACCALRGSP